MLKKLEFKIIALLFLVVVFLLFCLCFSTCWQYHNQSLALNTVLNTLQESDAEFDGERLHKSFYQATMQTFLVSFAFVVLITILAYFFIKKLFKAAEIVSTGADGTEIVGVITDFISKKILTKTVVPYKGDYSFYVFEYCHKGNIPPPPCHRVLWWKGI